MAKHICQEIFIYPLYVRALTGITKLNQNIEDNRFELYQADEFAIYTTPPSHAELKSILEIVKPKVIYVLGVSPKAESTDEFLTRLTGMTKYAINNKDGKVSVKELAVATAQRESVCPPGRPVTYGVFR